MERTEGTIKIQQILVWLLNDRKRIYVDSTKKQLHIFK